MRVEYILYLPAVFIKLDPNGQSLGSIYKSWCWKMALNSIKMVRWRSSSINTFPIFFLFLDFFNMFKYSTSTLDQNETFLRVNSSAMLM